MGIVNTNRKTDVIKTITTFSIIFLFFSCHGNKTGQFSGDHSEELMSMLTLKSNLEYLASDELEGREAGTKAEKVASKFIASELKKYGVETLSDFKNYFQEFTLRQIRFSEESKFALNNHNNEWKHFVYGQDFVGSNRYYEPVDTVTHIVFVGYGITAHEYSYDSYAGVDVKGKLVLFMPGEPESEDTTFFAGAKKSSYASSWSKIENAKVKGAAGVIYISAWEETYGWDSIVNYVEKGDLQFMEKPVRSSSSSFPAIVIRRATLENIFSQNHLSFEDVRAGLDSTSASPALEFESRSKVFLTFDTSKTVQVRNVVGLLPGRDPVLKQEYVSIGCHYDHEGIGHDGIYNGADDNASGTAAVLEIARMFSQSKDHKRSIIFNFHTAEEKGLLGSKYFTMHFNRINDIIAHINLDMIGRGPADSIYVIGSDKISTEFHDLIFSTNKAGVKLHLDLKFNDPNDPNRFYYRSDHYSFAKKNIPSVFLFDDMEEDYHKITDDADRINYQKLINVTRLGYDILRGAANRESRFISEDIAGK